MAEDFFIPDLPRWVVEPRMTCVVTSEAETGEDGGGIVTSQALKLIEPLSRGEDHPGPSERAVGGGNHLRE